MIDIESVEMEANSKKSTQRYGGFEGPLVSLLFSSRASSYPATYQPRSVIPRSKESGGSVPGGAPCSTRYVITVVF